MSGTLATEAEAKLPKIVIIGAGAAGISSAAKLLENGYNNILILEAQNRIGGRVNSVPFGKGYVDLGAQWCEGQGGNVVYELVKKDFEFGDTLFSHEEAHYYNSKGNSVDQNKCARLMSLSENIGSDYENMAKFNKSFGEFFVANYKIELQKKEFEDVDEELADQCIDLSERETNSMYASESWFDVSASLNSYGDAGKSTSQSDCTLTKKKTILEGNQQLTWKEHGYRIVFDFLTVMRTKEWSSSHPFRGSH